MRARQAQKSPAPAPPWVRPRRARWKACECALTSPGSTSPARRLAPGGAGVPGSPAARPEPPEQLDQAGPQPGVEGDRRAGRLRADRHTDAVAGACRLDLAAPGGDEGVQVALAGGARVEPGRDPAGDGVGRVGVDLDPAD